MKTAIARAGYTGKVVIGMDVAASEFYDNKDKTYDLNFKEEVDKLQAFLQVISNFHLFIKLFLCQIPEPDK